METGPWGGINDFQGFLVLRRDTYFRPVITATVPSTSANPQETKNSARNGITASAKATLTEIITQ